MSVTFYDPKNPYEYDNDWNISSGGPEANFCASNVQRIFSVLGWSYDPCYGEIPAEDMILAVNRAMIALENFCVDGDEKEYYTCALTSLRNVAEMSLNHGKIVVWS